MKKILVCLVMVTTLLMSGCGLVIHDYGCTETLNIVNHTDSEVSLIRGMIEGSQTVTTIAPGKDALADEKTGMCVKNTIPAPHSEEYMLFDIEYTKLKVNGKIVSWEIWLAKYWDFTGEVYHATYTLNITDELIESIGFVGE